MRNNRIEILILVRKKNGGKKSRRWKERWVNRLDEFQKFWDWNHVYFSLFFQFLFLIIFTCIFKDRDSDLCSKSGHSMKWYVRKWATGYLFIFLKMKDLLPKPGALKKPELGLLTNCARPKLLTDPPRSSLSSLSPTHHRVPGLLHGVNSRLEFRTLFFQVWSLDQHLHLEAC